MPPDVRALLEAKLARLREYSDELADVLASGERMARRRAIERLAQVIVECAGDLAELVLEGSRRAPPASLREAIQTAAEIGAIPEPLADAFLRRYVSLRNRIVHDYDRIDSRLVEDAALRLVGDARSLVAAMVAWMDGPGRTA